MKDHQLWFLEYANAKIKKATEDASPLELKLKHTMNVLDKAGKIAQQENFSALLARIVGLAALYHDLGRFDQYLLYGTFKDKNSINHALLAVKILKREKRLEKETPKTQQAILSAVGFHNRFALPPELEPQTLAACNAIRDADKLDILRVMATHLASGKHYNPTVVLGLPDREDIYSKDVITSAICGKLCRYEDLRSVNDFRVLLGSWFFGLNFESSRQMYVEDGHGKCLVEGLPNNSIYGPVRKILLEMLASRDMKKGAHCA